MRMEGKYLNSQNVETTKKIAIKIGILCKDILKELYSFSKVFAREVMHIYNSIGPEMDEWGDIIGGNEDEQRVERFSSEEGKQEEDRERFKKNRRRSKKSRRRDRKSNSKSCTCNCHRSKENEESW